MALPFDHIELYFQNVQKCKISGKIIAEKHVDEDMCFYNAEIFIENNSWIFKIPVSENLNMCTFDEYYEVFEKGFFTEKNPKTFSGIVNVQNAKILPNLPSLENIQIPECNLENFWNFSVKIEDVPPRNFFKNENILYISVIVILIFMAVFIFYKNFLKNNGKI